ncbi:MAG: peptidoglycan-binding protein [Myxococcota bacterium]
MDAVSPTDLAQEASRVAANDEVVDAFDENAPRSHTVAPGDTLSHIARDHGVSLQSVIDANPQIANPDRIYPGDQVTVPSGPGTAAAAGSHAGWAPAPVDGVLARGMAGVPVEDMQRRLQELGYATGPVDGKFGPLTQGALRQFQMQNDLNSTGRLDADTRARLESTEAQRYEPSQGPVPELGVYPPGSAEQIALFEEAARRIGVPESWARDPGLINILRRESGGRVGVPNYTYGARARDPSQWGSVHAELQNGRITARSSATGLGQLLLSNVERHYPSGRAGIGNPVEEAAGMLSYIRERYGHPATAWARYNTVHEGY